MKSRWDKMINRAEDSENDSENDSGSWYLGDVKRECAAPSDLESSLSWPRLAGASSSRLFPSASSRTRRASVDDSNPRMKKGVNR